MFLCLCLIFHFIFILFIPYSICFNAGRQKEKVLLDWTVSGYRLGDRGGQWQYYSWHPTLALVSLCDYHTWHQIFLQV